MAISSVGSYTNSYENLYTYNQTKKSETSEISEVKTETTKKSNNEEYLKSLQKQVPYMKLQIGYGLNTSNDGKVNMQVIIDAAQNREAVTTNTSSEVGKNFDFKI